MSIEGALLAAALTLGVVAWRLLIEPSRVGASIGLPRYVGRRQRARRVARFFARMLGMAPSDTLPAALQDPDPIPDALRARLAARKGPVSDAERHRILLHMAEQTSRIFREHGIEFWLTGGALLGAVRTGQPIEHDCDVDFALTREAYALLHEKRVEVRAQLAEQGLALLMAPMLVRKYSTPAHAVWLPAEITPLDVLLVLDLYVWQADATSLTNRHASVLTRRRIPRDWVLPTRPVQLAHLTLPAPQQAARYLEDAFGPDWQTPSRYRPWWQEQ